MGSFGQVAGDGVVSGVAIVKADLAGDGGAEFGSEVFGEFFDA